MAVVIAATLGNAAEAGQRQRSPGHNGGGQGQGGGGGHAQSGGGGGQAQSSGGGGSQGGGSQSGPRYAAPRENRGGGDRGDGGRTSQADRGGDNGGRTSRADRGSDNGGARQEAAPPQQTRSAPDQGSRRVQRWPDARVESRTEARSESAPQATVQQRSGGAIRRDESRVNSGVRNDTRVNGNRTTDQRVDNRNWNGRDTGRIAIPRQGPGPQRRDGRYAYGGGTYSSGGRYYTYAPRYYYSPRYYGYRPYYFYRPNFYTAFSFGYGPYGRGYFYYDTFYDSYVFYPRTIVRYGDYGRYGYPTGDLRLDIEPRDAQVYIDGAYAGLVDDFDGVFQSLRLEAGQYHVEVVLPGFETLNFDVYIRPGEKTTYRGDLLPERG
jgi:PEGA domain